MTPDEASENLVKRIRVMAEFIQKRHPIDFTEYWHEVWPGQARSGEVLDFFSQPDLEKKYVIGKKVPAFRITFGRKSNR